MWKSGDVIEIDIDMTPHFWRGERECRHLTSIYRGPVLLAFDLRYNRHLKMNKDMGTYGGKEWAMSTDAAPIPALHAGEMIFKEAGWYDWLPPDLLLETKALNGDAIFLCDFAGAGETGTPYRSWLPVEGLLDSPRFTQTNPLRSMPWKHTSTKENISDDSTRN